MKHRRTNRRIRRRKTMRSRKTRKYRGGNNKYGLLALSAGLGLTALKYAPKLYDKYITQVTQLEEQKQRLDEERAKSIFDAIANADEVIEKINNERKQEKRIQDLISKLPDVIDQINAQTSVLKNKAHILTDAINYATESNVDHIRHIINNKHIDSKTINIESIDDTNVVDANNAENIDAMCNDMSKKQIAFDINILTLLEHSFYKIVPEKVLNFTNDIFLPKYKFDGSNMNDDTKHINELIVNWYLNLIVTMLNAKSNTYLHNALDKVTNTLKQYDPDFKLNYPLKPIGKL